MEKKIETGTVKPITKVNFKLDKGLLIRGVESTESVSDLNECEFRRYIIRIL